MPRTENRQSDDPTNPSQTAANILSTMIESIRKFAVTAAILLAAGCQAAPPSTARVDWIETQMFFGLTLHDGSRIADADWHDFVDRSITPRFPDGFTLVYGDGQYRSDDKSVHKEPSAILTLLHPAGDDAKLTVIAREYDSRFGQQSVLLVDFPARTAFVSAPTSRP